MKIKSIGYIAISILIVTAIIAIPVIWLSTDPPIDNITITDSKRYMKTNSYIRKLLKKSYVDPFPSKIPAGSKSEYFYNYSCNFDGDLYFTVYLELSSMTEEDFTSERRRIGKLSDEEPILRGETEYVSFSQPDLEEYFSTEYSRKGFSFNLVVFENAEQTIKYLISYQCDNSQIPEQISELLNTAKKLGK